VPVVAVDVLEGLMAAVADAAVDLNILISSLTAEPIRPIVTHRDLMADALLNLLVRHGIHLAGCLADNEPQHLRLGQQLYEWELDALVQGEGFAEGGSRSCVGDAFADTEACDADAAWRMRFSCKKAWATASPPLRGRKMALVGTKMLVKEVVAWSVGMLNVLHKG
jgi:hypothetical protein